MNIGARTWTERRTDLAGRLTPTVRVYLVLLALVLVSAALSPAFLRPANLANLLRQAVPLGIVAIGQTIVILIGGIDVSVGSLMTLTSVLAGSLMQNSNAKILPVVAIAMGAGLLVGLINGVFVTRLKTDPFVTTLGSMLALQGVAFLYTGGSPRNFLTPQYRQISEGVVAGIPVPVMILALVAVVATFVLHRTVAGRRLYSLGSNPRAAYLSGHPVNRVQIAGYVACSLLAVTAGLILVARTGVGDNWVGRGMELDSIAAVLIGGTAFGGGRGTVMGTIAGVLILSILFNIVNLLALSTYFQLIVKGVAIVVGVMLYSRRSTA
jgi:ribose/xylose/arabinose/galactoside ABC-type transport system permease subunit